MILYSGALQFETNNRPVRGWAHGVWLEFKELEDGEED